MLQRLYVHNFRCFENFEFKPQDQTASLLLGKNGSGKSTVREVLALFQSIGRGRTRVGELVKPTDFTQGRTDRPMRFELEVVLDGKVFVYALILELPTRFRELRVQHESLTVDGDIVFNREIAEVTVNRKARTREEGTFTMDWHLIALPVIQSTATPSSHPNLSAWLSSIVLLAPIPQDMGGEALGLDTAINEKASNLADWLADLLESYPAAYTTVVEHLQQVMPDLGSFRFEKLGRDTRALMVQFKQDQSSFELPISALSDGEKCFFLSAVLLAANHLEGPLFAFWDEPDNYLATSEVNQFVVALKRSFLRKRGQLLISSHNPQAILCFSEDSTWVMGRRSHVEPSIIRCLDELQPAAARGQESHQPDLIQRLLDGELEPWR
jgi:ATPase subunit of ABC transporter with duplicated ATPase domains